MPEPSCIKEIVRMTVKRIDELDKNLYCISCEDGRIEIYHHNSYDSKINLNLNDNKIYILLK